MFTLAAPADHNDGRGDTTTSNNRPVPELLAHNTGETNTATTHQHAIVTKTKHYFQTHTLRESYDVSLFFFN